MNEQQDKPNDLTMAPNADPTGKPVGQPVEQPPGPEAGEGADGRPRAGNPNDGSGDASGRVRSGTWTEGDDAASMPRTDAAKAERARDMANEPKEPDPFHVGPSEEPSPGPSERIAMLVGGPRNGQQARIPSGRTSVSVDVDGKRHEYRIGANLPSDFTDQVPPQNAPLVHFGYYGPDAEHVKALRAQYRERSDVLPGDALVPGPRSRPSVVADE